MKKILHLSHTDIKSDSRILKSMKSAKDEGYIVSGIGIKSVDSGKAIDEISANELNIESLDLYFKKFRNIHKFIRHPLVLLEFYFKTFYKIIKINPTLIHCNDTVPLPISVISGLMLNKKIIYDAHELESEKNGLSNFMKKLIFKVEKICWFKVEGLIVVSPSIKEWYRSKFNLKPTKIVMNSPILNNLSNITINRYFHNKYNISYDRLVFLYIGGFMPGRGLEIIAEAIGSMNEVHVVFMGYGSEKENLTNISKIYKNIHIHDAVEHDRVVSLARSADIGLCLIEKISLSDYYCLPNKLFEYAFSQLPVLATNFPDICKVVSDYKLGVCVELNAESIQLGVEELINNYQQYKDNYKNIDLTSLGWNKQSENLISLYKEVLNNE